MRGVAAALSEESPLHASDLAGALCHGCAAVVRAADGTSVPALPWGCAVNSGDHARMIQTQPWPRAGKAAGAAGA